jgi:hypothetical protein
VVERSGSIDAGVKIRFGDEEYVVRPVHFPDGWRFEAGDWVGVDVDRLEIFPWLASTSQRGDRIRHEMPNDDNTRSRQVERMQSDA